MKDISILIPTYNYVCTALVATLQQQAAAAGIAYEVVVADDGSTDAVAVGANRAINDLPCCRYVERPTNSGRAAIRNFLATQARYGWLLFLDCDMVVERADFVRRYATYATDDAGVIDGGITIGGNDAALRHNLRYRYERAAERHYTAERRQLHPYNDFHTANFLVQRDVMLRLPFDERFRHYGYEDVLFGKSLQAHGVAILHVDNPLSFETFESNAQFLDKTEEGLRTLYEFRAELRGYSRLLSLAERLSLLAPLVRTAHRLLGNAVRRWLAADHVSLWLFSLYRLGYYLSLPRQQMAE